MRSKEKCRAEVQHKSMPVMTMTLEHCARFCPFCGKKLKDGEKE